MTQAGEQPVRRGTHPHVALVVTLALTLAGGWWKTDADKSKQIAEMQARMNDMPERRDREMDQRFDAVQMQIGAVGSRVDDLASRFTSIEEHLRGDRPR